ncbi:hypothetical protein Tco_0098020, partial [Tanacetum coccineum]
VDRLLDHEVERQADGLVEEVEGLENQRAELVVELQLQDLISTNIAQVGNHVSNIQVLMSKEFCPNNEMQKLETEFWCHAMVGAGHAAYTDRFHELSRLVPYLVTPENKRIERMLTDEAIRNGSLKKNTKKRGNGGELSRKENVRMTIRDLGLGTLPEIEGRGLGW